MAEQRTGDPLPDETKAPLSVLEAKARQTPDGLGHLISALVWAWELGQATTRLEASKGPGFSGALIETDSGPRPLVEDPYLPSWGGHPRVLGRVASSPCRTFIEVVPDVSNFKPGMLVEFGTGDSRRCGYARIADVSNSHGPVLMFEHLLNAMVPTIAEGDSIFEYEVPCTRCRCKRCASPSSGNGQKTLGADDHPVAHAGLPVRAGTSEAKLAPSREPKEDGQSSPSGGTSE